MFTVYFIEPRDEWFAHETYLAAKHRKFKLHLQDCTIKLESSQITISCAVRKHPYNVALRYQRCISNISNFSKKFTMQLYNAKILLHMKFHM